jgi:hypothetical protein
VRSEPVHHREFQECSCQPMALLQRGERRISRSQRIVKSIFGFIDLLPLYQHLVCGRRSQLESTVYHQLRQTGPSFVSIISSTCFFPYCSFSSRYIQLVWSSWNFNSLMITRRARSLADTPRLPESDWESVADPSRIMITKTVVALPTSRTTGRRDSALHVLRQPFTADKVHSYEATLILQSITLDRWSQVTIYAKPSRCNIGLSHEGFYHV